MRLQAWFLAPSAWTPGNEIPSPPAGGEEGVDLPAASRLAAMLETVRIQLEGEQTCARFPLLWRVGMALLGGPIFGWAAEELGGAIREIDEVVAEMERLPVSLAATVMLGEEGEDEGLPEVYFRVSPNLERANADPPQSLRTLFGPVLEHIQKICRAGMGAGHNVALVREGGPVRYLWTLRED